MSSRERKAGKGGLLAEGWVPWFVRNGSRLGQGLHDLRRGAAAAGAGARVLLSCWAAGKKAERKYGVGRVAACTADAATRRD